MASDEPPWAWLGLLKWSLAYSDGTRPSEESLSPMSVENKAFLEAVMKDGIIDENERMKTILKEVTETLDALKTKQEPVNEEEMEEILLELRDIVEQIDYARAFAAMKGLPFLLGCASERDSVPRSTRKACLGIIATMCQNNPPVQLELLNLGSLATFAQLYFDEYPQAFSDTVEECDGQLRSKIIQAMSANIRNHDIAEDVFCHLEEGRRVLASALGMFSAEETLPPPPVQVEKRALFLMRALVTSDTSSRQRVEWFSHLIAYIADNFTSLETDFELREMSVAMLEQVLVQKLSLNVILDRKNILVSRGVERVSAIRSLEGEEREFASVELELWENLLVLLARAEPGSAEAPLLLEDQKTDASQALAQ